MIAYFTSGTRPSLFGLSLLHAAARSRTVYVRDGEVFLYRRGTHEPVEAFHRRLRDRQADASEAALPVLQGPVLAALYRGDLDLPPGSECYALFRERQTSVIAASDLLSA